MNIFELMAKISLNTKDFDDKLGGIPAKIGSVGSSVVKGVAATSAAAIGAVTTGVVAMTKQAVASYGQFEQLEGGTKLLFGSASDSIIQASKNAYKTVQMSQNAYLEQVNGFAVGLKTSLEGNEQAAAELAKKIVQAEADVVAATGATQESVQNAFNGIMKGNFTMVDNLQLGIKPTKEGFKEMINTVNEWNAAQGKATDYQMENLADMEAALVDYISMQNLAGYASMEGADTITGSVTATKAAWENLLTSIGKGNIGEITADVHAFAETFAATAKNMLPIVQSSLSGIAKAIDVILPEIMNKLPQALEETGPLLLSSFETVLEGAVNAIIELLPAFQDVLPELINTGLTLMSEFFVAITDALPDALATIAEIINSIALEGGTGIIESIVSGLAESLPIITDMATTIILQFISVIVTMAPEIIQQGMNIIINLIQGLATMTPELVPQIVQAITLCVATIIAMLPQLLNAGIQLLIALGDGIMAAIPALLENLPAVIAAMVSSLVSMAPQILNAGIRLLVALGQGLIVAIPQLVAEIPAIIIAIVGGLLKGISQIKTVGSQLIEGLWAGIGDKVEWIKSKIYGFGNAVLSAIKGIFGIASPSKEFAEIGGYLAEGLGQGWDKDISNIQRDIEGDMTSLSKWEPEVSPTITPTITGDDGVSGTGGDIIIPIYLPDGGLWDEIVVNAQNRNNYRSGGR